MSRRIPLWCAGLSLVVVSAAAATHADAQVRSQRRIRRTGKNQPAQPAHVDTVTITRTDTVRVRDTVFVDRPTPPPPPIHDTVRIAPPPPPPRLAYFGVLGGVGIPLSATKNGTPNPSGFTGYDYGPSIFGLIGFNTKSGVVGLRLDGGYTLLRGGNIGNGFSAHTNTTGGTDQAVPDLGVYQGTLDLVLRAPFARDSTGADHGGFYVFGGGGVAYTRSFIQSDVAPGIEQNLVRPVVQGGAGLEVGELGAGKIFVEGRFVYVFTPGQKITMVPVGLGVRF